jgi:cell wall-associated NlpC family hydrolase
VAIQKKGIDCSYFVQDALKTIKVNIPRTTYYQSKSGYKIPKTQLQTGDLVFFKTTYKDRHVGIYLNKGHFMHVSTSKGVIISRMDNPYWTSHYWTSRRILE